MEYLHSEITGEIINAFYAVYNELGYGFLERVYKNALYKELKKEDSNAVLNIAFLYIIKENV